jgi:hypothetical protein
MDRWPHLAGYPGLSTLALREGQALCSNYNLRNQMFMSTPDSCVSLFLLAATVFSSQGVFRPARYFR